jgi:hypothetical protein
VKKQRRTCLEGQRTWMWKPAVLEAEGQHGLLQRQCLEFGRSSNMQVPSKEDDTETNKNRTKGGSMSDQRHQFVTGPLT